MSPRYDVFLSHATADKPAVEYLARKLRAVGIEPFFDKWHLVPGRIWQTELENRLRESRACAIFIGSEEFGPWHAQERLVALDQAARDPDFSVIPVLLPGFRKPKGIPGFLGQRTWVEFSKLEDEEDFHRLVCGIRGEIPDPGSGGGEPVKPPRPPSFRSMAPIPERGFVHRRQYDLILEALCPKEGATQSSTSIGITTALRGAGGFGKTALAQMLCQAERVQETYPDGILWTTMGEDIDANGRLNRILDLIRWWTKEEPPSFTAPAAAGAHLRDLLKESKGLIVLDDVWSSADVTPFQGIGNGSALLITTRDSQTLPTDSKKIEVDAMASAEAVSLLRSELPAEEEREFASLASRLGEWPLLLKMVNRQLRVLVNDERRPVPIALKEINEALDSEGFAAFDREDQESRHTAASKTILVSIQRLAEKNREQYFQLAVFPEDVQIPVAVLEKLWNLGNFQVRRFCRRLHELSLLLEFNSGPETVRLHDVVRRVLIEQIGDQLPDLHRHLLDTFRPVSGFWTDLPVEEEEYLWRNLAGHLLGAEKKDELRRLLTDLSFLQAMLNATDVNTLIADYQVFVEEERELRLIREALRLSAHILVRDRQQLASQLFGRLVGHLGEDLEKLLYSAKSQLRLNPRQGTLSPAGGALLRTLEGHSDGVFAVAVVDGRRVVSGSGDGTLLVWDLETDETLRTLEGHSLTVNAVAVVDGCRGVSGSDDGTLRLWDLETGETLRTLEGHSLSVNAVAVVDNRRAVSGSDDGALLVWDLETGETLKTLEGHSRGVTAVAVVDSRRAVSGSDDGTLLVWDLETGETLKTLEGHSDGVSAVAVVDSRRVISGSYDGTLLVWDLKTGEALKTLEGQLFGVDTVAVVDGRRAISGSRDGTLQVWDLEASETLKTLAGHSGGVNAVAVVDGRRAVSGSYDGTLRVWDLETGETLKTLRGHSRGVIALAVVDGRRAVSVSGDERLRVWDLETSEPLKTLNGYSFGGSVAVVDSRRAVSGSYDGTLRVWDLEAGEKLRTLRGYLRGVTALAVGDGRWAVSGSSDGTLRVRDLEAGENLKTLEGHSGGVNAVAVVDGHRVVSGSYDQTLRVWDLETGETLKTFEEHSGGVNAVAVLDGRRAVSGSDDKTLRVWDLETGEILAVVTLDAPVWAVAVSPDGRIVVAGDQAGKVHFLDWVEPPAP